MLGVLLGLDAVKVMLPVESLVFSGMPEGMMQLLCSFLQHAANYS
jgi:hypothetical protein